MTNLLLIVIAFIISNASANNTTSWTTDSSTSSSITEQTIPQQPPLNHDQMYDAIRTGVRAAVQQAVIEVISFHSQPPEVSILPDLSFLGGDPNPGYQLPNDPDLPANVVHGPDGDLQHFHWWSDMQDDMMQTQEAILHAAFKTADADQVVDNKTSLDVMVSVGPILSDAAYDFMNRTLDTEKDILGSHKMSRSTRKKVKNVMADLKSVLVRDSDEILTSTKLEAYELEIADLQSSDLFVDEINGQGDTNSMLDRLQSYRIRESSGGKTEINGRMILNADLILNGDLEYEDLDGGFRFDDVVLATESTNFSSGLDLKSAVLRTENLSLSDSLLNEAVFIDTDETMVPVQVEFDEVHIEKLTLHSGLLDSFPVKDAFLFTEDDQDVQGTLTIEDLTAKTLLSNFVNGIAPEEWYPDVLRLDQGTLPFPDNVIFSNLTMIGDLKVNGTVNQVMFPSDLFLTNRSQSITASLNMTNCTFEEAVLAAGEVDSLLLPADVIQLTVEDDEETYAKLYFKAGIDSPSVKTTGLLNGSNFEDLRRDFEAIEKEISIMDEIKSGVIEREVIINGNMSLPVNVTVAGLDLSVIHDDVIMKVRSEHPIVVAGAKEFSTLTATFCSMKSVNDVPMTDIASNQTKEISGPISFQNVEFTAVTDTGDGNSSIHMLHAVLQDYLIDNTSVIDPVAQVTIFSIITDKTINDITPTDITLKGGISMIDGDKKFIQNLTASTLTTNNVHFTKSLDDLDYEFFDKRITTYNDSHLTGHGWIMDNSNIDDCSVDLLFDGDRNISVSPFFASLMTTTRDQEVSGRITFTNRSEASGNIVSKYGLFRHSVRRGMESPGKMIFEEDLVVDAVTITGNVNEVDLSSFAQDTLRKRGRSLSQVVSSQESQFVAGIDALLDVNAWNVNDGSGHSILQRDTFNVLFRSGDQTVREHLMLEGRVILKNVTFEDHSSFEIPVIPEIPNNLTDCANTINFGDTTLLAHLGSEVTFAEDLNFTKFFGFDWSFLVDDIVMHNETDTSSVRAKKKFTAKVEVQADLDLDVATIDGKLSGHSIAEWHNMQIEEHQGLLSFMDDVKVDAAHFKARINEADVGPMARKAHADKANQQRRKRDERVRMRDSVYRAQSLVIDGDLNVTERLNGHPISEAFIPLSSRAIDFDGNVSFGDKSGVWAWAVEGNMTTACSLQCLVKSDSWRFVDDRLPDIDRFIASTKSASHNLIPCHANLNDENGKKCHSKHGE